MSIYLQYLNSSLLFLFTFVSFLFAQNEIHTGTLSVTLNSPGYIYLDSEYLSNSSIQDLALRSGEYKISVFSSRSRKWNERGYEKIITILSNQNTDLKIENTNLFYFNSSPYNSTIIQNNKIIGKTPAFVNSDAFNLSEKIIIKKTGYIDKDVFVSPNHYEYFFSLKPATIKNEINIASTGLDNSQATWFKEGFVVVSVLSSWAAFYFKREADKYYAKYPIPGNVDKLNYYYNQTKKFDRYSDISIGVSLASLGTYMYFLIFD